MAAKKMKAKEAPKPRIVILFVLMAVIFIAAYFGSDMPVWADILLAIFNADLVYYLFVVIKVHRYIADSMKSDTHVAEIEENARNTACRIAEEGIVLLKNENGLLPLAKGSVINPFGLRCVQMNYNGGGSAASDESKCTRLEQALEAEGFILNQDLLNLSYNYLKNGKASIQNPGKNHKVKTGSSQKGGAEFIAKPGNPVKSEIPTDVLLSDSIYPDKASPLAHAAQMGDVALLVLARGGGEGYDFDPSDLQLCESEKAMFDAVCRRFSKVILLINSANVLEMGWLSDYPQIKSVLWIGFPGADGNRAVAEILSGRSNPSGRLPDIWPASNMSAPASHNFREPEPDREEIVWKKESFHFHNAPDKAGYFVNYHEGIYVGYRYYETRAALDPAYRYDEEVVWPFGYGLSYTKFAQRLIGLTDEPEKEQVTVIAEVTNTGTAAGKEVIQIYVNSPYSGHLEKSIVSLCAFDKTELLAPGQSVSMTFEIPYRELASFDEMRGAFVIEAGEYRLQLQKNSHEIIDTCCLSFPEEHMLAGTKSLFADAGLDTLTRDFNPEHRAFTGPAERDFIADEHTLRALNFELPKDSDFGLTKKDMPVSGKFAGLKLKDMKNVPLSDAKWDTFVQQITVQELCKLCGNGAWQLDEIPRLGVKRKITPDGSTCLGSTIFSGLAMGKAKSGITWPCPTVLAASFNRQLAYLEGNLVGCEANAYGYHGWYAPSMNCHRTAFNSRNFEYYSEDGLLAGKMAAAVTKGVQEHRVLVFLKHFAVNEREENARNQLYTRCSEQALREIYLKPFAYAVKEGGALGVMSSFVYLGDTWVGGNKALLTDLLREEWGFQGVVVTDACLYPHMNVAQMIYAGGNLSLDTLGGLSGGNGKRRTLLAYAQDPERKVLMVKWLQAAAKNILYVSTWAE